MFKKLLILSGVFLFLFSSAVFAEESDELNQTEEETNQFPESKSDIDQSAVSTTAADLSAETMSPSAVEYDWIQLTSSEWLKGEIKGMYEESLEFDSDKLDLLNIDWEDVKIVRSYRVNSINIEGVGAASGKLEVIDNSVHVVNDYEDITYDRASLISFAPGGGNELDLWSVKAMLGLDLRQGNTDQVEYTAKINVKRRASLTRFLMDYIGNISKTSGTDGGLVETVNNHRLNGSFDYYKTKRFFYTPAFFEIYRDPFSNIALKTTFGAGIGYTVIDDGKTELSFAGGPAYVKTDFISVAAGKNTSESTAAAVLRTNYDTELTNTMDFIARYNIQVGNQASGGYTHHIILTLESEITGSLDLDTSFIWDRTSNPAEAADGTIPQPDDYRITLGVSYTY